MTPLEQLDLYIQQHHLRRTFEREEILRLIVNIDAHFTTKSLYNEYQKRGHYMSLASFYNNIEFFLRASLIVKHPFVGAEQEYELLQRAATHHHRICTECGTIKEFSDKKFSRAITSRTFTTFDTQYHSIYLYGICSKCQKQKSKTKK